MADEGRAKRKVEATLRIDVDVTLEYDDVEYGDDISVEVLEDLLHSVADRAKELIAERLKRHSEDPGFLAGLTSCDVNAGLENIDWLE